MALFCSICGWSRNWIGLPIPAGYGLAATAAIVDAAPCGVVHG